MGAGHPALQRAVRKILGRRRSDRSDRPRGVVGARSTAPGYILVNPLHAAAPITPMEPSPYLPTSRRFVNPLYLRPEAIPEFADAAPSGPDPQVTASTAGERAGARDADRQRRGVERQARRARKRLPGQAIRRPPTRLRGFPRTRRRRSSTPSRPGVRWPSGTARTGIAGRRNSRTRQAPAVADFAAKHADSRRFSPLAAVAARRPAGRAQSTAMRAGMELGIMHDLAVGVRPERSRRLGDAGRPRARRHRGRAAGRVQPARPGLVAAAVATRPARRSGLRAVPGHGQRDPAARRAASASTTSSGCSGCGGSPRARRPPRAPMCATTTRR